MPPQTKSKSKKKGKVGEKKYKDKVSRSSTKSIIILLPALGCPGIVDNGKLQTVVLLKEQSLATSEYLADRLRYLSWNQKDGDPASGTKFQPQDIEIRDYKKEFESYNYISPAVLNAYYNMGFKVIAYVLCKVSGEDGLYNLVTPYNESRHMRDAIKKLPKPYSDCPMIPDNGATLPDGSPVKLYHPFLVSQANYLGIAHVTDTHLAFRWELLDKRVSNYNKQFPNKKIDGFNNYNKRFAEFLKAINNDNRIHIVLVTGDLIDYNRGHRMIENLVVDNRISSNNLFTDYFYNRNWLLFYKLLVENYKKKAVFTILGNHDYRLNPYAPLPRIFWRELYSISYDLNILRSQVIEIHENARDIETGKDGNLYTTYESVAWYSFVINPLFDYTFFYKNMAFIMFDWNKEEDLEDNLPWAENSLSQKQQQILNRWLNKSKGKVKVLGMHAPVYNPFPEIGNKHLKKGLIYSGSERIVYRDGQYYKLFETMPIKIFKGYTDNRNELVDGTFRESRNELIKLILDNDNYGENDNYAIGPNPIHVIVTGHAHRNGIYQVIKDRVKLTQWGPIDYWKKHKKSPLFVNTVSAGPVGFDNESGFSEERDGLKHRYLVKPGYRNIIFDSSGKVEKLEQKATSRLIVRSDVDKEFKD
jgi:3',5'-cyclic AMP phosphodiesterase CpdA